MVLTAILVACVGLAVIGFLVWGMATDVQEPLGPAVPGAPEAGSTPALVDRGDPDGLRADSPIEVGVDLEYKELEKVFTGRGTISGTIDAAQGVPFPDAWELVIEPSQFGLGREHAETRVLAMPGAQRTFEEHDLPLAGYKVSARAAGLECAGQEVLLFKLQGQEHLPGVSHKHVMLRFHNAGSLDGVVRDEAGGAVAGLPVFIDRADGDWRTDVVTNGAGAWRVSGLLDGRYTIKLGSRARPLAPAQDVVFESPTMHLPDTVLPVLGAVRLQVVDADGRGLPEATVRGFGPAPIDTETDLVGEVLVRFLPSGRYQVRVEHAATGGEGKLDFEVLAHRDTRTLQVMCRPR